MVPVLIRLNIAIAGVVLSTSIVSAQQAVRPRSGSKPARPSTSAPRVIQSLINGVAVDSNRKPLPNAAVRLRNLAVNAIEQATTANLVGEFTFVARPEVPYVVEMTDSAGRAVAVGDVIFANAGEVAGALVAMPSHLPPLAAIYTETASAVTAAATDANLTVIDPDLPPVSPKK